MMTAIDLSKFVDENFYPAFVVGGILFIPAKDYQVKSNLSDRICQARISPILEVINETFATRTALEKTLRDRGRILNGYIFDNHFIPLDPKAFYNYGFKQAEPVNFLEALDWAYVSLAVWPPDKDRKLVFLSELTSSIEAWHSQQVQQAFVDRQPFPENGINPSLRTIYLSATLARAQQEFLIQQAAEKAAREAFLATIEGRIGNSVQMAGGVLNSIRKIGNAYEVRWTSHGQNFNTLVNENMRVVEAGICVSGHDREHTLGSLIAIEQLYQREGAHYVVTRR